MKWGVLYAIGLLFQIYKIAKMRKSISYYNKIINQISGLDVLKVKQLKIKIMEGVHKIGDYVLCSGIINTNETITSVLNPNIKVAYSQVVMNKVFQIGQTRNTVRKPIRKLIAGFLTLSQKNDKIKIFETANSNLVCDYVINKKIFFEQKLLDLGWLISSLLKFPTRVVSNIYYQSFIPNNSQNTVFGKISKNKLGQIQFFNPVAIAKNKQKMLQAYFQLKRTNIYFKYFLYLTLMLTFYFFWKQIVSPFIRSNLFNRNSKVEKIQKIQVKDYYCSKCHKSLSNIINRPCDHLVICSDCNVQNSPCPECLKKPSETIMVYPC